MAGVSLVTGINNNRPDVIMFQKCATSVASVCVSFPVALSSSLSLLLAVKVERGTSWWSSGFYGGSMKSSSGCVPINKDRSTNIRPDIRNGQIMQSVVWSGVACSSSVCVSVFSCTCEHQNAHSTSRVGNFDWSSSNDWKVETLWVGRVVGMLCSDAG